MKKILPWIAIVGAGVVVAACNTNNNSVPGNCGSPSGVSQIVLVYPAPGATGVPDSIPHVIVGATSSIPQGWGVTALSTVGQAANGVAFTTPPSPLPTPNQLPTFANPTYYDSPINASPPFAGSTVAILLNNVSSDCVPNVQIGTFTTQ